MNMRNADGLKGLPKRLSPRFLRLARGRSEPTRRIFAKFGVSSRAAMVAKLLEANILSTEIFPSSPVPSRATRPSTSTTPTKTRYRVKSPSTTCGRSWTKLASGGRQPRLKQRARTKD